MYPDIWQLIVILLAVWRIVTFIQDEAGPWSFMLRIRCRLGVVHDNDSNPVAWPDNLIGKLLKCFWCLSFWAGIFVYLLWLLTPVIPLLFAISAGAILLNEIIQRLKDGNRNT